MHSRSSSIDDPDKDPDFQLDNCSEVGQTYIFPIPDYDGGEGSFTFLFLLISKL